MRTGSPDKPGLVAKASSQLGAEVLPGCGVCRSPMGPGPLVSPGWGGQGSSFSPSRGFSPRSDRGLMSLGAAPLPGPAPLCSLSSCEL